MEAVPARRSASILVVEDEADIREVLRYNLQRDGYEVYLAADGEDGLDQIRRRRPDLILLDLLLPGLDGLEICRQIKYDPATRHIPVIMVTAKSDETDVVLGLGVGADDYVAKPFSPRELVARVRAVLRRGAPRPPEAQEERLVHGPLVLDAARHEAALEGRPLLLTPTEFRLLGALAARPGRVFTRRQLLDRVSGEEAPVTERSVDVHVRSLRKKLDRHRDLVETVRGVGYRLRSAPGD